MFGLCSFDESLGMFSIVGWIPFLVGWRGARSKKGFSKVWLLCFGWRSGASWILGYRRLSCDYLIYNTLSRFSCLHLIFASQSWFVAQSWFVICDCDHSWFASQSWFELCLGDKPEESNNAEPRTKTDWLGALAAPDTAERHKRRGGTVALRTGLHNKLLNFITYKSVLYTTRS